MNILRIILGLELLTLVTLAIITAVFWNMIKDGELRRSLRNKSIGLAIFLAGLFLGLFLPTPLTRAICFAITSPPLIYFMFRHIVYLFKTLN